MQVYRGEMLRVGVDECSGAGVRTEVQRMHVRDQRVRVARVQAPHLAVRVDALVSVSGLVLGKGCAPFALGVVEDAGGGGDDEEDEEDGDGRFEGYGEGHFGGFLMSFSV